MQQSRKYIIKSAYTKKYCGTPTPDWSSATVDSPVGREHPIHGAMKGKKLRAVDRRVQEARWCVKYCSLAARERGFTERNMLISLKIIFVFSSTELRMVIGRIQEIVKSSFYIWLK